MPSSAVIVHIAAPQGAASAPLVQTKTTSIPAPTTAQLRTLHALFQLILTDWLLNFRQAHHALQTLIFDSETLVCAIATRAALSGLWKALGRRGERHGVLVLPTSVCPLKNRRKTSPRFEV